MKQWFLTKRREWCLWRGHPQAPWSPIVMNWREPDRWENGRLVNGAEFTLRTYRCAKHDRAPK